jgi:hypothetical protein
VQIHQRHKDKVGGGWKEGRIEEGKGQVAGKDRKKEEQITGKDFLSLKTKRKGS